MLVLARRGRRVTQGYYLRTLFHISTIFLNSLRVDIEHVSSLRQGFPDSGSTIDSGLSVRTHDSFKLSLRYVPDYGEFCVCLVIVNSNCHSSLASESATFSWPRPRGHALCNLGSKNVDHFA